MTNTTEFMLVSKAALNWLNGSGPDANGHWFGDAPDDGVRGAFWWRTKFAAMVATPAPEPQPEVAAEPTCFISKHSLALLGRDTSATVWPDESGAFTIPLYSTAPVVEEAVKAEPIHQQFRLKWDAAPRPPAHPYVMHGQHTFPSFATALAFMMQQPDDSAFVSLMQIDSYETDRSDDLRSARSAAP